MAACDDYSLYILAYTGTYRYPVLPIYTLQEIVSVIGRIRISPKLRIQILKHAAPHAACKKPSFSPGPSPVRYSLGSWSIFFLCLAWVSHETF